MPHAVTVTGSRHTGHREPAEYVLLFDAYLRPFAGADSQVYVAVRQGSTRSRCPGSPSTPRPW